MRVVRLARNLDATLAVQCGRSEVRWKIEKGERKKKLTFEMFIGFVY